MGCVLPRVPAISLRTGAISCGGGCGGRGVRRSRCFARPGRGCWAASSRLRRGCSGATARPLGLHGIPPRKEVPGTAALHSPNVYRVAKGSGWQPFVPARVPAAQRRRGASALRAVTPRTPRHSRRVNSPPARVTRVVRRALSRRQVIRPARRDRGKPRLVITPPVTPPPRWPPAPRPPPAAAGAAAPLAPPRATWRSWPAPQ